MDIDDENEGKRLVHTEQVQEESVEPQVTPNSGTI